MSELPCVGAGITVVDPGRKMPDAYARGRGNGRPKRSGTTTYTYADPASEKRLLHAYVTLVEELQYSHTDDRRHVVHWRCGKRDGSVYLHNEGVSWTRGHGPQARGALLAARALEQR